MQVGICEWCAMAGGEELFRRLQRTGLNGVQVSYEATDFVPKMEQYARLAADYGVTLTSVGANIFCERAVFAPENAAWVRDVTADICRGAALTEGRLFHVPAFGASYIRNEQELCQTVAALQSICDVAAAFDVTVAAENALPLAENERLLEAVNRPNLKLYFDTQNPQTAHGDAAAQAAAFAARIPEVHVKDCNEHGVSVPLGTGVTGFDHTLATLLHGGYDGWLLLENAYNRAVDPDAAMRADADYARTACRK
jgi:sugar phosphate isomerase/epimerase